VRSMTRPKAGKVLFTSILIPPGFGESVSAVNLDQPLTQPHPGTEPALGELYSSPYYSGGCHLTRGKDGRRSQGDPLRQESGEKEVGPRESGPQRKGLYY